MFARVLLVCVLTGITGCSGSKTQQADPEIEAKKKTVKADLETLTNRCSIYFLSNQEFPKRLAVLVPSQIEADQLLDPWGNEYRYDVAGKRNKGLRPDIWTTTPDKQTIGNW